MSDLEKAIEAAKEAYMSHAAYNGDGLDALDAALDAYAARRQLNLTSPETIEKATEAVWDVLADSLATAFHDPELAAYTRSQCRDAAEAVLRSVEEGKT